MWLCLIHSWNVIKYIEKYKYVETDLVIGVEKENLKLYPHKLKKTLYSFYKYDIVKIKNLYRRIILNVLNWLNFMEVRSENLT